LVLKQFYIKNVGPEKIQRVQQKIPRCWTYVQQNENNFQKVWGTPASSITNIGRHDIAEILPIVALSTKNQIKSTPFFSYYTYIRLSPFSQQI
jgi:hypothetical protein